MELYYSVYDSGFSLFEYGFLIWQKMMFVLKDISSFGILAKTNFEQKVIRLVRGFLY